VPDERCWAHLPAAA